MKAKPSSSEISHMTKTTSRHHVVQWDDSDSSHVSQPDEVGYLSFFRGPTLCVLMRKTSVLFLSKAVRLLENQGNVKDLKNSIQTKHAVKKNEQSRRKRGLKLSCWKRKMSHLAYVDRQMHGIGIIWIVTLSHRHSEKPPARHSELDPLSFIKREFLTHISICSPPLTVFHPSNAMACVL